MLICPNENGPKNRKLGSFFVCYCRVSNGGSRMASAYCTLSSVQDAALSNYFFWVYIFSRCFPKAQNVYIWLTKWGNLSIKSIIDQNRFYDYSMPFCFVWMCFSTCFSSFFSLIGRQNKSNSIWKLNYPSFRLWQISKGT